MSKKKRLLMVALICTLALAMAGGTLAYWTSEGSAVPIISTGSLSGEVREVYNPPDKVYPGTVVEKIVNVENTGSIDMIVRIKLAKDWGSSRGEDGKVIPDENLSTDNIEIVTNTKYWMYAADGYYYYKGILEPGQTTMEPLFKEFKVGAMTDNEYNSKLADIIVSMECIQAGGNAIAAWNKSYEELGVAAPKTPVGITTKVVFVDPDQKFTFDPISTGIFDNFNNIVPGETRVQNIEVKNTYKQAVEIFLLAEYLEQSKTTPENAALVNELLQKYVIVTITDKDGNVLYKGPVWGNYLSETNGNDSMKESISLGSFAKGEMKDLTVTLTLDPSVGNEYQNLLGLIKWVFKAQGDEITINKGDTVKDDDAVKISNTFKKGSVIKTGDNSNIIFWMIGLAASIIALGIIFITLQKKHSEK